MTAPGQRIGDFVIERELGRGGMGIVYSAVHHKTSERAAIKLLSPRLLADPRQRKRFQREAHVSRIRHTGLVRVFSHGEAEDGAPYILMEYLEGLSLHQLLLETPAHRLPVKMAVQISLQLAEALHAAHCTGLVHSDIKPSNVMLVDGPDWHVKLLDFGVARLISEGEGGTTSESDIVGTPAYMSPEQCQGRSQLDGCSDVYGLGALLFEMLCGRPLFIGPKLRVMYQHVYESPLSVERFRPEVSAELCSLIRTMLAKVKQARPEMGEIAAQLRALYPDVSPEDLGRLPALRPPFTATRRALQLSGLGLAIAALSSALLYAVRPAQPGQRLAAQPPRTSVLMPPLAPVSQPLSPSPLPPPPAPSPPSKIPPFKRDRPAAQSARPQRRPVGRPAEHIDAATAAKDGEPALRDQGAEQATLSAESTPASPSEARPTTTASIVEYWK